MALPAVSWTIDGLDTPLQGWSATTAAFGGFGSMRGVIKEVDARRIPSTVTQGSIVTGYTQGGFVVYQGRLSAPPAIRGGLASFAAQGEAVRAAKRTGRLLYQSRDARAWTTQDSDPHNLVQQPHIVHAEVRDGSILFMPEPGVSLVGGEDNGVAFWAPGGFISRVAYHRTVSGLGGTWRNEIYRGMGPSFGAGSTQEASYTVAGTPIDEAVANNPDMITLTLAWISGSATSVPEYLLIHNIRVNGIAPGDEYYGYQVVTDVGARLGYDTTGVIGSGTNVLPLDWTSGSWAELLSYIATLEDRYWRVVEDSRLEYSPWGTKEWTVYQADGATVDLTPLELYNKVVVHYVTASRAPGEVTVTADPDPLAASGITNVWEETLPEVQPNTDLANAVANNLLPRVSTLRETGRIDAVKAYDSTGREAVREIKAGDTIRVADRDMNTATVHRVFETDQDSGGVSLGIEGGVSIASMLGRAGLVSARAPSTMELPELEIAAVEFPVPSDDRNAWMAGKLALQGAPDTGMPDKRHAPGTIHTKKGYKKMKKHPRKYF